MIGLESKPVTVRIESDSVKRFVEAIGLPFENMVPPTYVGTFMNEIAGIQFEKPGSIHGQQKITSYRQLAIGDFITYSRRVKDVYKKSGRTGPMTFICLESIGRNSIGEVVFSCITTIIWPEKGEGY
jgi:hypothetical protein